MIIAGLLSISQATKLQYPFLEVIRCLDELCDVVIVGVDPVYPEDEFNIRSIVPELRKTPVFFYDTWLRQKIDAGREIAEKMQNLVSYAERIWSADWVVVLQADELLHEEDFHALRLNMTQSHDTTGFSTERLYFWKDLSTVRSDWNAHLVRIFRPRAYSFLAENTDKAGMYSGQTYPGEEISLSIPIYHYSRVDPPDVISKRLYNLDTFFHPTENLVAKEILPNYDFIPRQWDNFNTKEPPPVVEGKFEPFLGTHPKFIKKRYGLQ